MSAEQTRMFREAGEAPARVAVQLADDSARIIADAVRRFRPRAVVTCARGSSDHAATFARYLIETHMGLITASASPSVSSLYRARPDMSGCLFLAISQSGKSPDLLAAAEGAKASGALVLALVNDVASPLALAADHVLPLHAGPEASIAATKSYICALTASLNLVAHWQGEEKLLAALKGAPTQLEAALRLDWSAMIEGLREASNLFVLGRGLGLGVAQEAALKLKETCGIHAEAFSSAEVRHGPMALLKKDMPALIFIQDDETREGQEELARELKADGVRLLQAGGEGANLPSLSTHPALTPLLFAQSFYPAVAALSLARGLDPDHPPHLQKVTETF